MHFSCSVNVFTGNVRDVGGIWQRYSMHVNERDRLKTIKVLPDHPPNCGYPTPRPLTSYENFRGPVPVSLLEPAHANGAVKTVRKLLSRYSNTATISGQAKCSGKVGQGNERSSPYLMVKAFSAKAGSDSIPERIQEAFHHTNNYTVRGLLFADCNFQGKQGTD